MGVRGRTDKDGVNIGILQYFPMIADRFRDATHRSTLPGGINSDI
jgi:hypothetical protein